MFFSWFVRVASLAVFPIVEAGAGGFDVLHIPCRALGEVSSGPSIVMVSPLLSAMIGETCLALLSVGPFDAGLLILLGPPYLVVFHSIYCSSFRTSSETLSMRLRVSFLWSGLEQSPYFAALMMESSLRPMAWHLT